MSEHRQGHVTRSTDHRPAPGTLNLKPEDPDGLNAVLRIKSEGKIAAILQCTRTQSFAGESLEIPFLGDEFDSPQ